MQKAKKIERFKSWRKLCEKGCCFLNLKFIWRKNIMWDYMTSDSFTNENMLWVKGVFLGSAFAIALTTLLGTLGAVVT